MSDLIERIDHTEHAGYSLGNAVAIEDTVVNIGDVFITERQFYEDNVHYYKVIGFGGCNQLIMRKIGCKLVSFDGKTGKKVPDVSNEIGAPCVHKAWFERDNEGGLAVIKSIADYSHPVTLKRKLEDGSYELDRCYA
ncbi:hypothetical protein ACTXIV_02410 [Psychrobacter celer]|uniref:hypothetical protein n=1 Tax=Psychrobacter celer TaxID=306572 RepID=UPI003FD56F4F